MLIEQAFANFKRNRAASFQHRPGPRSGGDKVSIRRSLRWPAGRCAQAIVDRIIDQRGMPPQRPPLGGCFKISFAREAILDIGEFVAQGRHHLGQHHAAIGFDDLGPIGIPLRGKIQKRAAQTREVARQIVDWKIDQILRRTFGFRRFAVELARATLFEGEFDSVEKAIDAGQSRSSGDKSKSHRARRLPPPEIRAIVRRRSPASRSPSPPRLQPGFRHLRR